MGDWFQVLSFISIFAIGAGIGAAWGITHVSKHPEDQEKVFLERFWGAYLDAWMKDRPFWVGSSANAWWTKCQSNAANAPDLKIQQKWHSAAQRAMALQDFIAIRDLERDHLQSTGFIEPPVNDLRSSKFRVAQDKS